MSFEREGNALLAVCNTAMLIQLDEKCFWMNFAVCLLRITQEDIVFVEVWPELTIGLNATYKFIFNRI